MVIATAEEKAQVRNLLASLPADERLLLQLRFEQDLSLDEVAKLCGLGDGQRAHRKMTAILKKLRFAMRHKFSGKMQDASVH